MKRIHLTLAMIILTLELCFSCFIINTSAQDTEKASSIPEDAVLFNGHYYKIYVTLDLNDYTTSLNVLSWTLSEKKCEELGGHLVTITSAEEQAFIESINNTQSRLWMGAFRIDDGWGWVTGEAFEYTNWGTGEPNNIKEIRGSVWPKKWNDLGDDSWEQTGYICEWDDIPVIQYPAADSYTFPSTTTTEDPYIAWTTTEAPYYDWTTTTEYDYYKWIPTTESDLKSTSTESTTEKKDEQISVGGLYYKKSGKSTLTFTGAKNKKIKKLAIPDTVKVNGKKYKVTAIEKKACQKLSRLKSVTIGNNVKEIGSNAFKGCKKLKSITIGTRKYDKTKKTYIYKGKLTTIGTGVLSGDVSLNSIQINSVNLKTIGKKTFRNVPSNVNIYVPANKLKKYASLIKKAK